MKPNANMLDLIIIGAGPAGIALAAEAHAVGHHPSNVLILEKGAQHNWAIRQYYPAHKKTTANYKGHVAQCEGPLCITDMSKDETIAFSDQVIASYEINNRYDVEAFAVNRHEDAEGAHFQKVQDDAGRPRVVFKEESYPPQTFDSTVYALGGTTPVNFLRALGVLFENGMPKTDRAGETNVPGLFLIGDLTVGKTGESIITAFNSAARAIKSMDKLMRPEKLRAAAPA